MMQMSSHDRVMAEIRRLGLSDAVAQLEADGLAIVPPEVVGLEPGYVERVLERVLDVMERRNGVRPDIESGETHRNVFFPTLYYFLFEDPVFQEWLLHPAVLALATYLLGESCILSATTVFMKGPADESDAELQLGLHSDQQMVPQPFPPYALICGATLLLTDYSRATGAFAYVPGSHKLGRHPGGRKEPALRCRSTRRGVRSWSTTARCGTGRSRAGNPVCASEWRTRSRGRS